MLKDIYLCVSKDKKQFTCEYFNSFWIADRYYNELLSKDYKYSTILTTCSFVPNFFKYKIFDYKLNKLFGQGTSNIELKIKS
jgi:hypothetical protein